MFTRTTRSVRIFNHTRGSFDIARRLERFMRTDLRFVFRGAFFDIGLHVKLAAYTQQSSDLLQQVGVHDETFRVFLFPPGIRKVQEKRVDRGIRTKTRQSFAGVAVEHASTCTESLFGQTLVDDGRPLEANFQTEEPTIRRRSGSFEHETATTWTDLDFDRTLSGHERIYVDVALVGKTSSMSVGMIGSRLEHHGGRQRSTLARSWVALAVISSRP